MFTAVVKSSIYLQTVYCQSYGYDGQQNTRKTHCYKCKINFYKIQENKLLCFAKHSGI